jgi:hypothetical protein
LYTSTDVRVRVRYIPYVRYLARAEAMITSGGSHCLRAWTRRMNFLHIPNIGTPRLSSSPYAVTT